ITATEVALAGTAGVASGVAGRAGRSPVTASTTGCGDGTGVTCRGVGVASGCGATRGCSTGTGIGSIRGSGTAGNQSTSVRVTSGPGATMRSGTINSISSTTLIEI